MHLNQIKGDYIFYDWKENAWKEFKKKEHELRLQGFRKINKEYGHQDLYITYKNKEKRIMLTMVLS
jgi:hypothetical protein